jgi:outer membrane lipoprotein-sorting protein
MLARFLSLVCVLTLVFTVFAQAQSVEEVLQRAAAALGSENSAHIKTLQMKLNGEIVEDVKADITILLIKPDRLVYSSVANGNENTLATDGTMTWRRISGQVMEADENLKKETKHLILYTCAFLGDTEALKKAADINYGGTETYENGPAHALNLKFLSNGRDGKLLFCADSGLPLELSIIMGPGYENPLKLKFSDFREVDGVKIAHSILFTAPTGQSVTFTITNVTINGAIAESSFTIPE